MNGLPVLDFDTTGTTGRHMAFVKGIDNVHSVFAVFGSQEVDGQKSVGPLLGYYRTEAANRSGGYDLIEAHPAVPAHAGGLQWYAYYCPGVARYGEILVYDCALTAREVAGRARSCRRRPRPRSR